MDFIIGGAYQGKLTFAKNKYGLKDDDIFTCTEDGRVDFTAWCVRHIEEFTFWCVRNGEDPVAYFKEHRTAWENSVLICRDIFCGVVPMETEMRAWREQTGRLCAYLSGEAQSVSRIFCGLEQKLK